MSMLTADSIQLARQWYADLSQACIDAAVKGEFHVNDLASYIEWQRDSAEKALAGEYDHTFTMQQRAYYIQTGECPALLP